MSGSEHGWFDPDSGEHRWPVCTRAGKDNRFAGFLQAIETLITFGGCPWGGKAEEIWGDAERAAAEGATRQ